MAKIILGDVVGPPGVTGTAGKSAYVFAQEAGYRGTESEFAALQAGIAEHITGRDNPHQTNWQQTGAEKQHVFRTITLPGAAWSVPISGEAAPVTAGEMEVMPAAATGSAGGGAAGFAQVAPVAEIIKTDNEESWVWVTPVDDEANLIAIEDAFVRPTEIGNGTLTFAADSLPAAAVGFVVEVGGTGERSAQ